MSKVQYKRRNAEKRKAKAKAVAEARAKRTPAQQLARLDAAGHVAKKERARLAKLIK